MTWVNTSVNPRKMLQYVKARAKKTGVAIPKEYKYPSDDAAYACEYDERAATLSMYLRTYQSRGFTFFRWALGNDDLEADPMFAAMDVVKTRIESPEITLDAVDRELIQEEYTTVIRGLDKFTGLTAADEDEVSDATDHKSLFFAGGVAYTDAQTLFVTTKSNGENAKATLRKVGGQWWVLAGSKNVCLLTPLETNPRELYDQTDPTIPSWKILNAFYDYVTEVVVGEKNALDTLGARLHDSHYVFLFEFNNATHEHLFPIEEDFLDGFAIRGVGSAAIDPVETCAIFDEFGFPRVKCERRDISELDDVVAEVRADCTVEGVVIYFMLDESVVGLLKVKSDFYTLARATREQFKRLGNAVKQGLRSASSPAATQAALVISDSTVADVKKRIKRRMARMTQIPGTLQDQAGWAARGLAFCDYWLDQYYQPTPNTVEAKEECIHQSRAKFGTLYAEFYAQYVADGEVVAAVVEGYEEQQRNNAGSSA